MQPVRRAPGVGPAPQVGPAPVVRPSPLVGPAVTAATTAYLANCALGVSVALRLVDTSQVRWVHHGMYVLTSTLTAGAFLAAAVSRHPAAIPLACAALPLFALQAHGARPLTRHARDAVLAAPAYAAAAALTRIRS